jgi:hypothetical protein
MKLHPSTIAMEYPFTALKDLYLLVVLLATSSGEEAMKIEIHTASTLRSKAVMRFVRERLESHLGHLSAGIQSVRVRLEDLNGPKGGIDKECFVEVTDICGVVMVSKRNSNLYQCIGDVTDRLAELILRRRRKARSFRLKANMAARSISDASFNS